MASTESILESITLGQEIVIKSPDIIKLLVPSDDKIICGMCSESVQLFHIPTQKFTTKLRATTHVNTIACYGTNQGHPEKQIICGGANIRIYDMNTGKLKTTIKSRTKTGDNDISSVSVATNPVSGEPIILSSANDDVIYMWDLNTGQLVSKLENFKQYLKATLITRNGLISGTRSDLLAIYNSFGKYDIDIIDIAANKCIQTLEGHTNKIIDVRATNNGRLLISSSWDNTIKIWDTTSWECIRTLTGHNSYINSIFISPDDKLLVSSDKRRINIWDIESGRCIKTIMDEWIRDCPAIIHDNMIIYGTHQQRIKLIPYTTSE